MQSKVLRVSWTSNISQIISSISVWTLPLNKQMSWDTAFPTKLHMRPGKAQISLCIREVWSEYAGMDTKRFQADSEYFDQPAHMSRLISIFAGRTYNLVGNVVPAQMTCTNLVPIIINSSICVPHESIVLQEELIHFTGTSMTSYVLYYTPAPYWDRVYSKLKHFALKGSNFWPFSADH